MTHLGAPLYVANTSEIKNVEEKQLAETWNNMMVDAFQEIAGFIPNRVNIEFFAAKSMTDAELDGHEFKWESREAVYESTKYVFIFIQLF